MISFPTARQDYTAYETATTGQMSYIRSLATERDLTGAPVKYRERVEHILATDGADLTKAKASVLIDWLTAQPRRAPAAPADMPEVPAGRYAIPSDEGHLSFYKVDRPTEGRWAGFVFVRLVTGDEEHRLSRAMTRTILERIEAAGPEEASRAYGREIGACGVCGRTLTNEDSRAAGIGPVCREKF